MFDFVKCKITYMSETELLQNSKINWIGNCDYTTGEIQNYPIIGSDKNIKFKINSDSKTFKGSIHKLWNIDNGIGEVNYNDFTYLEALATIDKMVSKYNLKPSKSTIENLEVGFNVITSISPTRLLSNNLKGWHYEETHENKDFGGTGKYIEFATSQYYVKIYDKGKHQNQKYYILRCEIKFIRNDVLSVNAGIVHLSDLYNISKVEHLLKYYFDQMAKFIIVDDFDDSVINKMTPKEKEIFTNVLQIGFWNSYDKGTKKVEYQKAFDRILSKYNLDNLKKEVLTKLNQKVKELAFYPKMNDFKQTSKIILPQNETLLYFHSGVNVKETSNRVCRVTGIPITHGNKKTKVLNGQSLINLCKTDNIKFTSLLRKYQPKAKSDNLKHLCEKIAHNLRNNESNDRNNLKRAILSNLKDDNRQPYLFAIETLVDMAKESVILSKKIDLFAVWENSKFHPFAKM